MAAPTRTSQLNKVHKVLKKHYQIVPADPERTVFEQLVFACCLENAHSQLAEEAYAALEHNFFDWNEIRVTTIRELSEVMACLPRPPAAANRLKRVLQSIFESTYSYELEELRKQNLGPAVEHLRKLDGTTNFSVAYVTQVALGGHAIPVDAGVLRALRVVELVTPENVKEGVVPGLERAISKSKGLEFASQLHQFGADFIANPFAPALHAILLEIDPQARQRLPKRRPRKRSGSSADSARQRAAKRAARKRAQAQAREEEEIARPKRKQTGEKTKSAEPKASQKPADSGKKAADPPPQQTPADQQAHPAAKRKPAAAKKRPPAKKKSDAAKAKAHDDAGPRKSTSAGLSKRKPR